jgi:tetratricopeptide (TPR) repeat protein
VNFPDEGAFPVDGKRTFLRRRHSTSTWVGEALMYAIARAAHRDGSPEAVPLSTPAAPWHVRGSEESLGRSRSVSPKPRCAASKLLETRPDEQSGHRRHRRQQARNVRNRCDSANAVMWPSDECGWGIVELRHSYSKGGNVADERFGVKRFWSRMMSAGGSYDGDPATARARAHRIMRYTLIALLVVTIVGSLATATYVRRQGTPTGTLGTLLLLSGAALVLGTLVGFLFGIPRTLQGDVADKTKRTYQVNTNLEQISDWLTKIIVGLTLVNLREIPNQIMTMNAYFAPAFGGGRSAEVLVGGAAVYFSVTGFFWGYLGTRLYLAGAIPWADDAGNISEVLDAGRAAAETAGSQQPIAPDAAPPAAADAPAELKRVVRAADATRPDPSVVARDDARTIALSYYATGRFKDAIPYFDAANTEPAADPQFTLHHAVALGETEQYRRAVSLLELLARQGKGVPNVYQLLGYYLLWLPDRLMDAVRYNQKYLSAITEDDAAAFFNTACAHADLYAQLRNTEPRAATIHRDQAQSDLKRAIALDARYRARAIELRERRENFTSLTDGEFEEATGT